MGRHEGEMQFFKGVVIAIEIERQPCLQRGWPSDCGIF